MKHSIVIGLLLAVCACNPTGTTYLGADPNAGATHVGGSAANTTNAVDGTYRGISHSSASAASQLTGGTGIGSKTAEPSTTGCQQFDAPPTLTVTNGLAQFQTMGVTFAGYVTPQGHLTMHSGYGATLTGQAQPALVDEDFDGDIDYRTHVLHAKVHSINCNYDLSWQRVA
ncbi:MAG: hypothetical protein JO122_03705 [Acetobacteraceae bacterium]|nr:hypothetical protein [Acetobacteraceae bacterium]